MNQSQALKILKTGANVFLTGEPGSGKTYVINQYVAYLNSHAIKTAVTASTGIAATHIGGMTIHSWSGIGIKNSLNNAELQNIAAIDYVKKRVESAKVLIIDEISMLPPQTLQMIDLICREIKKNPQPFGNMQVVLVGDFFQLPPIVKNIRNDFSQENLFEEKPHRFACDSPVWKQAEFVTCYITEQYRQDDKKLLSILSKIRSNSFDKSSLDHIQERKSDPLKIPHDAPKLFSHNIDVDKVNDQMLAEIPKEAKFFPMTTKGHESLINAMKKGCLSPVNLFLKISASVMFTKNNPKEGFVNGTLGIVDGFKTDTGLPIVKIRNGRKITVSPAEWIVEEDGKIKGRLSQIPLRLAWAITVHKSQGISLDEAVIDLSKVFEYGQGYVAISRVKRLSGVYILGWNKMAFEVDPEVLEKDKEFRIDSSKAEKIFSTFTDVELEKMQNDFITRSDGEINLTKKIKQNKIPKPSTLDKTLNLWEEGNEIKQIAISRNLSENTILDHIEELVKFKKIKPNELTRIIPTKILRDLPKIHSAFLVLDTNKLAPIFEYFKGKYSYRDLKLSRMMIK
ncbi:MAG: helix-turn-helix domain-containing protein [Patescibacteria group bacterium]|jgi:nucleoside-triphosphatase THEP1